VTGELFEKRTEKPAGAKENQFLPVKNLFKWKKSMAKLPQKDHYVQNPFAYHAHKGAPQL